MTDFDNFPSNYTDLSHLILLNLENTNLTDIEGLKRHFIKMPNLAKLILNKNKISSLGHLPCLDSIVQISLENNVIESTKIFAELSQLRNLNYLNIKHNPLGDKLGHSHVR